MRSRTIGATLRRFAPRVRHNDRKTKQEWEIGRMKMTTATCTAMAVAMTLLGCATGPMTTSTVSPAKVDASRTPPVKVEATAQQYVGKWRCQYDGSIMTIAQDGTGQFSTGTGFKWQFNDNGTIGMKYATAALAPNGQAVGQFECNDTAWIENGELCKNDFAVMFKFTRVK